MSTEIKLPAEECAVMLNHESAEATSLPMTRFQREAFIRAMLDESLARVAVVTQAPYDPDLLAPPAPSFDFNINSLVARHSAHQYGADGSAHWTMHKPKTKPTYSHKRQKKTMRRNKK